MLLFDRLLKGLGSVDAIDLEEFVLDSKLSVKLESKNGSPDYLIIDDYFIPAYANELKHSFEIELKTRGSTAVRDPEKFSSMFNYDAYSYTPPPSLTSPFRVFYSREWYASIEKMSGRTFDENVMTTLHHHEVNSDSGYIHTDYGIYAFRHHPFKNQLNHWYHNSIYQVHKPGDDISAQEGVIFTRRSVVILYYLDEGIWQEGDGGETGFFSEKNATEPILKIAPKFNRLLVFKITPRSFHAFIKNVKRPRNTLIQWFHEPFDMPEKYQTP